MKRLLTLLFLLFSLGLHFSTSLTAQDLSEGESLPGGHVKMSGHYRLGAGIGDEKGFFVNDANANQNMNTLQGPNFRYLYGERRENTYDPAVYSQYLLNVDFSPVDRINFYTQIVNDPWSWVGTTGEQVQASDIDPTIIMRYNLKYFGAFNSTLGEVYRNNIADRYNFPEIKVHNGHLSRTTHIEGFDDFDGVRGNHRGIPFTIPELDIDYEYRPIRKLWMDYKEDEWHVRLFALADQSQALTSDDPLELSNHKDYWQQSPWLYDYKPAMFFTDFDGKRMARGYYSSELSFLATDSEGNRLVLLRGASFEGDFGKVYLAATVAAPYTPWDEDYFDANNIPGAVRLKLQVTDSLMVGGTYTFRSGLVDGSMADFGHIGAVDFKYQVNPGTAIKGEIASSHRELDLLTDDLLKSERDGYAYHLSMESKYEHKFNGKTELKLSFTHMDRKFEPLLSRYLDTRDDSFWGNHISFNPRYDLEPFRIGDGVDVNRFVFRFNWKEKLFRDKFENLFDVRNVHKSHNTAYVETVIRDEVTYHINSKWTLKGLFRWRGLPLTTPYVEPTLTDFYFPKDDLNLTDFTIINDFVEADKRADQFTYSLGLQWLINKKWTAEGIAERTNAIPDFPRGLLNDFAKGPNERLENITIDRILVFLYGQNSLHAVPPYDYFSIFKERLIYKPRENLKFTAHATQNTYHFAGGIDDNITHVGLSGEYTHSNKWIFFADYTYSRQIDIPKLIATEYAEADNRGHHNVYFSMDYRINPATIFRTEYGVFDMGASVPGGNPYSVSSFSLPTLDTEHLLRLSLNGDF